MEVIKRKEERELILESDRRNPQYIARRIKWYNTVLVNICDEELLGKTVKGNGVDMHISRDYFGNERVSEQEAINMIKESSIVNLAGSRIVEKVVKAQLASKLAVKNVGSVSFLMIYKFTNSRIEQGI
jgi:hypothetical protein